MSATIAFFLLAALPIAQLSVPPAAAGAAAPRANRRILAPEIPAAAPTAEPPTACFQPDDARLCDVCFVDPRCGWAVGDHGAILHTDDGGQHWSHQASGVICTLNSVFFLDDRNGWAAGGMAYPYLHDSSGVVLSTRDGGLNWQVEPAILPAVRKIRFWTDRQGWAVGCPSAMFPGGIFVTRDGGQSWQPACHGGASRLATGDYFDGRRAMLGGELGLIATITEGEFSRNPRSGVVLPGIHRMQAVPPHYGWLVGDGGWVALTGNRGTAWRPPLSGLPPWAVIFDLSALCVRGPKCWIAGSPGSRIFFTPDAGKTWSAFPTGGTVPLRGIDFVDDLHGWAVGDLGMIVASNNGGQTWRRQRAGGARAAVMAMAGVPQDLPLELLARICREEGHLGVAEVLGRTDVDAGSRGDVSAGERLHEAMLLLGASAGETAWAFPVRQRELMLPAQTVLESWNRVHNGRGADALLAHVVRQIRTWRPSVILVPAGRDSDGLSQIVEQTLMTAVRLAGDPSFLVEQFGPAGCEPWNVQKSFLVSDCEAAGAIALVTDDWSSRLGRTWADAALPARGLFDDDYRDGPAVIRVRPVSLPSPSGRGAGGEGNSLSDMPNSNRAGAPAPLPGPLRAPTTGWSGEGDHRPRPIDSAARFDLMAGLASAGGPTRRPTAVAANSFSGPLDGLAQGRQVQAVFEHVDHDAEAVLAGLVKGGELPSGIDASAAAVPTFRIAQRLRHSGRWDLADKTLALLAERYPFDPLARCALAWRFQYLAASEAEWGKLSAGLPTSSRAEQALALARQMETYRPDLFASPAIRYPLAAVHRRLGQDSQAQRFYVLDPRGVDRDAWWDCARGETWLLDRKGPPPKPLAACIAASERPRLDGRLDEALWAKCTPLVLSSPVGDDRAWPAKVMLAHDAQFLYLAIHCRQAPGARYEAAGGKLRTRRGPFPARSRRHLPRPRPRLRNLLSPGNRPSRLGGRRQLR